MNPGAVTVVDRDAIDEQSSLGGTGGTFTWLEGKVDSDDNGSYDTYLAGNRIPPLKVTGCVEHDTTPRPPTPSDQSAIKAA